MRGNSKSGRRATGDPGASVVESLSETKIERALLLDALQHPMTILPVTLYLLSILYLVLLSPVLGGTAPAIILISVAGVATAANFFWRYFARFDMKYAGKARELVALMEKEGGSREREIERLRDTLESGFAGLNRTEGLKALEQLNHVYDGLQPVLESQTVTDPMSVAHIPTLAEETYRQGLSVLSDALELTVAGSAPGRERLEREVADLEKEIKEAKEGGGHAEPLRIKEASLSSHRQRLDMLDQLQLLVDQLLFQAERCEASLHRTRIEVAAIRTGSSETNVDSVIQALQTTIHQTKEVQEEMKKLGY